MMPFSKMRCCPRKAARSKALATFPETVAASAPHMPPMRPVTIPEHRQRNWEQAGGTELEPALASGAIALLDAEFLVRLADGGGVLCRRQELPDEAFLSLPELKAACLLSDALPIIALSYAWLQRDHPDPKGNTLRRVAEVLRAALACHRRFDRCGVFWDLGSLHQHSSTASRSADETCLFEQGLSFLAPLYSHVNTWVFRVTTFPSGYPAGYALPADATVAEYANRGWVRIHDEHAAPPARSTCAGPPPAGSTCA
jgi:hypothetical protein